MRQQLEGILTWVDGRTPRERFLLLLTAGAVVWIAWSSLVMDPLSRQRDAVRARLEESIQQTRDLEQQAHTLARRLAESPDAANRRSEARLREAIGSLDTRLAELHLGVVSPSETARVLEELLDREKQLQLVRLETQPPKSAFGVDASSKAAGSGPQLFQHDVVIELEGTYLSTLRYLRAIQALPWRLYWDEFHYVVTEHPEAHITIRLHTFGFEEAWIGV